MSLAPLPPDRPGEDDPPDLDLALNVVLVLLGDLDEYVMGRGSFPPDQLRPRIGAVSAVVRRIREART